MLNISKTQRKDFQKHFISNAFVEVRFTAVGFEWGNIEEKFKNAVTTHLPVSITRKAFSTEFRLNPPTRSKPQQNIETITETIGLIAQDKENTYSIQLLKDRIIFSTQKYNGFSSFWTEIEKALRIFKSEFGITHLNWLGVRKINEILITNSTGTGYSGEGVNRQIFTPIKEGVFESSSIGRAFNRYELKEGPCNCIIDSQVSEVNDADYLLKVDLDFNEVFPNQLEITAARDQAFKLNERLFEVFVWSVSDDVISTLESV